MRLAHSALQWSSVSEIDKTGDIHLLVPNLKLFQQAFCNGMRALQITNRYPITLPAVVDYLHSSKDVDTLCTLSLCPRSEGCLGGGQQKRNNKSSALITLVVVGVVVVRVLMWVLCVGIQVFGLGDNDEDTHSQTWRIGLSTNYQQCGESTWSINCYPRSVTQAIVLVLFVLAVAFLLCAIWKPSV